MSYGGMGHTGMDHSDMDHGGMDHGGMGEAQCSMNVSTSPLPPRLPPTRPHRCSSPGTPTTYASSSARGASRAQRR